MPDLDMPDRVPRVGVKVQYIKDLSFEVPGAPEVFTRLRLPSELRTDIRIETRLVVPSDRTHEVVLTLRVIATHPAMPGVDAPSGTAFIAELSYAGLFTLDAIPDDIIDEALQVECPHILYPFACHILIDLARDANFPLITLPSRRFPAAIPRPPDAGMSAPEQDPTFAQLRDLLALVADADPATIGPETRPADLAHWSSLTFIVLMAGIDKRFGIRMDPARAVQAETAGALASLIRAHPAGAARDG